MKKILSLFILFLTLVSAHAQRTYESVEGDPMKVRIYTLQNGLKVYLSQNAEQPRITAHIAVNTGHRNDPAETTGLAHYLEHLMFKGTKQFGTSNYEAEKPLLDKITELYEEHYRLTDPEARKAKYHEIDSVSQLAAKYNIPNEYDKLMAAIGGEGSNAYTWFDITCYTEDVPSNEVENWAKIQSDRFQNMVIRGFHTELESVYEEKNISLADDGEKVSNAGLAKLFPSHSYGTQTTIGTQEHLKNPSIVNIQNYYNKYYKPNNIAICMVGDFEFDKVMNIIEQYFGSWQPGNDITPRQFPAQPAFTAPQDTTVMGIEQEYVTLGWRFKGAASMQCDTLSLIGDILDNGTAGLLNLNLNQRMKVQQSTAGMLTLKDYSALFLDATPNDGQTLDEAKALLLAEIEKLKKGEFDESLISAVVNNMKLHYNNSLTSNRARVSMLVNSYINGQPWQDAVQQIDRISRITKQDIMHFASEHLNNGYVCVYKRQGEDPDVKKVDKPAITPIPSNRDLHSAFIDEIVASKVEPIQPVFVDYAKDLTLSSTKSKLPFIYKQNTDNQLFTLLYRFDFGNEADNRYSVASDYLNLLGTSKLSNEDIRKQFYALACSYHVVVEEENINIIVSGLNENMPKAVALLEDILKNAKADNELYQMYVEQTLKSREDAKLNQKQCFYNLWQYAMFGSRNPATNIMSADELKNADPNTLTDLIKNLTKHEHTVIYYGPSSQSDVLAMLQKQHKVGKKLVPALKNIPYQYQLTPQNEVLIAPYEANNIYMRKYHNEGKRWSPEECSVQEVFNEYFGGGMNTIVFQELREARGLAYTARASYVAPDKAADPEYSTEYIISQNDKLMDCISVFADITDNMPQSQANFNLAKQSIEKNLACQRITRTAVIDSYLTAQKLGIDYNLNKKIYEQLPAVTLSHITQFEQKNMANKPWLYVILGNEKELDMDSLSKIGTIKRVTLKDIFGY